ncbi:NADP-dependent oxidoreductase [Altererythrobacter sp. BO-6]|uniref:NADP-dependent oxidoreductase n=1 Tax=Altererythrobacter sp. BO-6 TaxID=2604537 RepID=UPI0013E1CF83|nr:NADP-dependent oxidoreductase [Altererythrobacter sp. BO-6]QIG54734.1 NADP-dependent oxidoreductase [Altererythrobacter sp. BO-6]
MVASHSRKVILTSRPQGVAQAENFAIVEREDRAPGAGELLVENLYLSVEPAMRGWIADAGNYSDPVGIGQVMRALAVGRVLASGSSDHAEGDLVCGWFGWQERATVAVDKVIRKVPENDLSPSLALGVLGINGVTAYLAMTGIGEPKPGETVVVSTAAGSVGSAAGQVASILGARTVGITGGPAKVRQCIDEFGYDAAIDYRAEGLAEAIAEACPDGVNVYYDNTAGAISDAVYPQLAIGARVVVCGTAAIAQWDPWPQGPRIERHLLVKRARMQGFVIFDHMDRWDAAVAQLSAWIRDGRLTYREDVLEGIEACPDALAGLYRGENMGKRVIRLACA